MNNESIKAQLELCSKSIDRALIPFQCELIHPETVIVSVYEALKTQIQLKTTIDEMMKYVNENRSDVTNATTFAKQLDELVELLGQR